MTEHPSEHAATPQQAVGTPLVELRWSARLGYLRDLAADKEIARAMYALVLPLTFERHTRRLELRKGHYACARSFAAMPEECLDRFHDDVLAVRDYLIKRGTKPIHNVEGFVTRWLTAATVDGHYARRGEIGAHQKPRVPKKIAAALHDDDWLVLLAKLILIWAGIPANAGAVDWPVEAWAELRARHGGTLHPYDPARVARDVERVLAVMRSTDPGWHARYVERPMGRKPFPVAERPGGEERGDPVRARDRAADSVEGFLDESAKLIVEALRIELDASIEPPDAVVRRWLEVLRESCATGVGVIDEVPHSGPADLDEVASVVLSAERIERLIPVVLDIIGPVEEAGVGRVRPGRARRVEQQSGRRSPQGRRVGPAGHGGPQLAQHELV